VNSVAVSSMEAVASRPSIRTEQLGMCASPQSIGPTAGVTPIVYVVDDDVLVSGSGRITCNTRQQ
jgi:hypothetical protein